MINESKVNGIFIQSGGSCVLSSYAIVANYFCKEPVFRSFEFYCQHFSLTFQNWQDAEAEYAGHFDKEWKNRHCLGYEIIIDLHQNSLLSYFSQNRVQFNVNLFKDSYEAVETLEKSLLEKEAFLNITFQPTRDYHSVTVFNNGKNLRVRDTNKKFFTDLQSLESLGKLKDCVLYTKNDTDV